jgi:SAM-dependent methyltransferase
VSASAGSVSEIVETAHFRVVGRTVEPRFPDACLDNQLADHIAEELVPLGLVPDAAAFEQIFVDTVVASAPSPVLAWSAFYRNTLNRLRGAARSGPVTSGASPARGDSVLTFARIYSHVPQLIKGTSVLDVGCCFGFLPLLLAERNPALMVVGCDVVPATSKLAASVACSLASRARFIAADAGRLPLRPEAVDTALLVHVLEHLPEASTLGVLSELRRVTRSRVVVAVPFEEVPDPTYGHVQAFDRRALGRLGAATGWSWTIQECEGGWLILDRPSR